MNLVDRAKNIIVNPNKEWDIIASEIPDTSKIITSYVLPLAGLAALAAFIGFGLIGVGGLGIRIRGINWGVYYALIVLVSALLSVFVSAFVIDLLAPSFGSEKNLPRSLQLVAYSFTPAWVGGLLSVFPPLSVVGSLFGLYGLYLLYLGMLKLKKTPQDKLVPYFVISLLVIVGVYYLVGYILALILMPMFGPTAAVDIINSIQMD